jgi:hypothetical protein
MKGGGVDKRVMSADDRWIARNFDMLVDLYGGRSVAIVRRRIVAVSVRPEQAARRARRAGARAAVVIRVPRKERLIGFSPFRLFDLS